MNIARLSTAVAIAFLGCVGHGRPAAAAPESRQVEHSASFNGKKIRYSAALETFEVDAPGHPHAASITVFSYIGERHGQGSEPGRPVLFAFNGGPGASSISVHLYALGPQRIDLPSDVDAGKSSRYPLVHNDDSILDTADLVLIDPPETGFSRVTDAIARTYFFSVGGDAAAVTDVIGQWIRKHQRDESPIYVLGVSYGALRAVEVGNDLVHRPNDKSRLQGIVLVSPSIGIGDTVQARTNIVGQVLGLKVMAATSWYHHRAGAGESLDQFTARAENFAAREWLRALLVGTGLQAAEREQVAKRLASFTAIPVKYLLEHDLYLPKADFRRLVLADQGLIVGESDSRYKGPAALGKSPDSFLQDVLPAAAADVLRSQLGMEDTGEYRAARLNIREWLYIQQPFDIFENSDYAQFDYLGRLLKLMSAKQDVRLFVGGGWFDTTASAGAQDYQFSRPGFDARRMTIRRYPGGHGYYSNPESRIEFARDLRKFIAADRGAQ